MKRSGKHYDDQRFFREYCRTTFLRLVEREELQELDTDEFIDVVRKVKDANPDFYSGITFKPKIPELK